MTTRSSTVPFPWAPCWRRRQWLRRQHTVSRAREISATSSSAPATGVPALSFQQCTTKAEKSASSTNLHHAPSPTAEGPMSAGIVSRTTQLQNVILQAQSPLNHNSFSHYLACHPNRQWSASLLQGICEGVDIGYQGIRKTVWSGNWKSALDNGSVVRDYLAAEVALGRKAGPFNQPPFATYIGSPMGVVVKKCSDSALSMICHGLLGTVSTTTLILISIAASMLPSIKQFPSLKSMGWARLWQN